MTRSLSGFLLLAMAGGRATPVEARLMHPSGVFNDSRSASPLTPNVALPVPERLVFQECWARVPKCWIDAERDT